MFEIIEIEKLKKLRGMKSCEIWGVVVGKKTNLLSIN